MLKVWLIAFVLFYLTFAMIFVKVLVSLTQQLLSAESLWCLGQQGGDFRENGLP